MSSPWQGHTFLRSDLGWECYCFLLHLYRSVTGQQLVSHSDTLLLEGRHSRFLWDRSGCRIYFATWSKSCVADQPQSPRFQRALLAHLRPFSLEEVFLSFRCFCSAIPARIETQSYSSASPADTHVDIHRCSASYNFFTVQTVDSIVGQSRYQRGSVGLPRCGARGRQYFWNHWYYLEYGCWQRE